MALTSVDSIPFLDLATPHAELRPAFDRVWNTVADSGAFIGGELVEQFEEAWAAYCGASHAVGVANGTDSIELILRALGVGPGDEVVVPANTFIATAEAVVAVGATPVFVDVDPHTLLVTAATIAPAMCERTAAVIVVHLYGQTCEMDDIAALVGPAGVPVVEDAAQAHGATWNGRRAGTLGAAASFSFYPGKNLGAFGDAGAVVTNDEALAATVRSLANHGRADGQHVEHPLMGRNSRMDGIQGGVLLAKLDHLDSWNAGRRRVHATYMDHLRTSDAVPVAEHPNAESVWHLNVVQVPQRDRVREAMGERGIDCRIHYPQACHQHPLITDAPTLAVVEASTPRILSLPMYPHLSDEAVARVCGALDEVLAELS